MLCYAVDDNSEDWTILVEIRIVTVNLYHHFSSKQHARKAGHSGPHNTYIADSGPALECPSGALSSNTALERALPSFSLHFTMVTNDSRVTEASWHPSSTASFPEALNLDQYGPKSSNTTKISPSDNFYTVQMIEVFVIVLAATYFIYKIL